MMKQKNRPITGSLKERTGKYTAVINAYDENGKRQQKYHALGIPVKGNKRKAEAALQEILRQYESEDIKIDRAKAESPLFADFLKEWLELTAPTIERTTYQSYKSMMDARLDRFFRERKLHLNEVEARHIRELHQSIFADGCNANSVIHYHAVVRKALQYAVKNELISTNVADMVDRPKKNKYLAAFYSRVELSTLFEATKDDPMAIVIQLAAFYGLRRSEVLGLRWSSIDFVQSTLSINHKVTEGKVDGKMTIFTEDKLKTKSSFRTLPLIPCVRELLFAAKERQSEYRSLFKGSYCRDYEDYICVDQMGKLFRPNYITDHFKLLLKQNELRKIRFHDLRHSCASLLLAQGISMKQIQDWLGHSTFNTTADIYSHLDFSSKQDSANAISAALNPLQEEPEEQQGMTMQMM
jgi:integrase